MAIIIQKEEIKEFCQFQLQEERNTCIHEKPKKQENEANKESYRKPNVKKAKQLNMQNGKANKNRRSYTSKVSKKSIKANKK